MKNIVERTLDGARVRTFQYPFPKFV